MQKNKRDLQARLTEIEKMLSEQIQNESEHEDMIDRLKNELKLKKQEVADLEEKNKKLMNEC